jgi:hypothetical protein
VAKVKGVKHQPKARKLLTPKQPAPKRKRKRRKSQ